MRVYIEDMATELKERVAWQKTPEVITDAQYYKFIVRAVMRLYIDTGRAEIYSDDIYKQESSKHYLESIYADEMEYILLCAEVMFFRKVQTDVNNIVSYTTDAMSITNADKPYAHLQDTIEKLDNDIRRIFYKMIRFSTNYAVSD